ARPARGRPGRGVPPRRTALPRVVPRPARRATGAVMLEVWNLRKVYDAHGRRVEAIGDLTFTMPGGQFACVVGPSGCGKTTLLRCAAGLLPATAGEIIVDGDRKDT